MGNSGSSENKALKRTNSERSSKRLKTQTKPHGIKKAMDDGTENCADIEQKKNIDHKRTQTTPFETENTKHLTKDKDATEKECLLNLQKRLSHHEHVLDSLAYMIESHKGIIDRLSKPGITNESANETSHSADYYSKQMEDSADELKRILKPYEPIEKALKDSFTDVRGAISNCLKQFGKNDLFTCIQHEKLVPEKHLDVEKDNVTQKRNSDNKVKRPQQMVDEKDQQTPLQLFYKHDGKTIEEIEKGIKTILVNKIGVIDFTNCQNASDIDGKTLLIVPCIVTSRVAADAENALKDIPNPENTALVVIHNKEAHALPTQKSSLTLTDQKFKNLREIIDLAFTTGNGFYHCDMNSRGIDSLCSCCRPTPRNEVRL